MGGKKIWSILILLALAGMVQAIWTPATVPVAAMKTGPDGYFYVPNIAGLTFLKVDLVYSATTPSPSSMWCDNTGGASPYPSIGNWPDGKVDTSDFNFVNNTFGATEGSSNWDYMADCVADTRVNMREVSLASNNLGKTASYISDPCYITILFDNSTNMTPNADGYVQIPAGAKSFVVFLMCLTTPCIGYSPAMALVTFYSTSPISTKLTQTVSPPTSTGYGGNQFTFTCGYYYKATWISIGGASVSVVVDSSTYTASPSASGDYTSVVTLNSGNHTWNCIASEAGYQSQVGSSLGYYVPLASNLEVFASPASRQYYGKSITFSANYSDSSGSPLTGATVTLYIDGTPYSTSYANGLYSNTTSTLSLGTHFWNFTASKTGYQPANTTSQSYVTLPLPTDLTQSVYPPSGVKSYSIAPTFMCGYYDNTTGTPVTGATVNVTIDSSAYTATYNSSTGDYRYSGTFMSANTTHSWYCSASKSGYTSQVSQLMSYNVTTPPPSTPPAGGSPLLRKVLPEAPAEQPPTGDTWTFAVVITAIIGLGIGYFVVREVMFSTATGKAKKGSKRK